MYANRPNGDNLLTDLDIQNEAFLRSTDLPRTKMSMLCVLASLFPPQREQKWSDGLGQLWQPVAFDAVPSPKDYVSFLYIDLAFLALRFTEILTRSALGMFYSNHVFSIECRIVLDTQR